MEKSAGEDIDFSKIFNTQHLRNLDDYIQFRIFFDISTNTYMESEIEENPERSDILLEHKYTIPAAFKSFADKKPSKVQEENSYYKEVMNSLDQINLPYIQKEIYSMYMEMYDKHLLPFITQYTWTGQPFFMAYVPGTSKCPAHLHGQFRTADNIQENWLVACLLNDLSKEFPDISITLDSLDGNFLLIESADFLPPWLTPESAVNRVFLRRGSLYILPKMLPQRNSAFNSVSIDSIFGDETGHIKEQKKSKKEALKKIELVEALSAIKFDSFDQYIASFEVQNVIDQKMSLYAIIANHWLNPKFVFDSTSLRNKLLDGKFEQDASSCKQTDVDELEKEQILLFTEDIKKQLQLSLCMPYKCNMILPLPVARLINEFPQLLGLALDHIPPSKDIYSRCKNLPKKTPLLDCTNHEMVRVALRLNRSQYTQLQNTRFQLPFAFHAGFTDSFKEFMRGNSEKDKEQCNAEMIRGLYISVGLLIAFIDAQGYTNELIVFLHNSTCKNLVEVCEKFASITHAAKKWGEMEENEVLTKPIPTPPPPKKFPLITELSSTKTVQFADGEQPKESSNDVTYVMKERKSKLKPPKRSDNLNLKTELQSLFDHFKINVELDIHFRTLLSYLYYTTQFPVTPSTEEDDSLEWLKDWESECTKLENETPQDVTQNFFAKMDEFLKKESSYEGFGRQPLIVEEQASVTSNEDDFEADSEDLDYVTDDCTSDFDMKELMKEMDNQLKKIKLGKIRDDKRTDAEKAESNLDSFFRSKNPEDMSEKELNALLKSTFGSTQCQGVGPNPVNSFLSLLDEVDK